MAAIASRLPEALRVLASGSPRWIARVGLGATREELLDLAESVAAEAPSLEILAERLEAVHLGFATLEWVCDQLEDPERRDRIAPGTSVSPRLLVARLDLGLRFLRLERGLTLQQLAEPAGLKPATLSAFERPEEPARPSLTELDAILGAIPASYDDLETAIWKPFRLEAALHRQLRREQPLTIRGRLAPRVLSERFDLALKVLRHEAGLSQGKLGEASGLGQARVGALERWSPDRPASEEEVEALLRALEATPEDLEEAAANAFARLQDLDRRVRTLERELARETPLSFRGEELPRILEQRLDLALRSLRMERGWSRSRLAKLTGLLQERIGTLETWGQGEPATEAELEAVLRGLEIDLGELVGAARQPLRAISRAHRESVRLQSELERERGRLERKMETLQREHEEALARAEEARLRYDVSEDPRVQEHALAVARSVGRLRRGMVRS